MSSGESSKAPVPVSQEEVDFEKQTGEENLDIANERKLQGNEYFRAAKWNEALVAYRSALNCLPKRPEISDPTMKEDENSFGSEESKAKSKQKEEVIIQDISSPQVKESSNETVKLRAVLNANIGACFVRLGDHKEVVKACSDAILDDSTYVRALERRAASNDVLNTWTSLTATQEDYNVLLKLSSSPSQQVDLRRKLQLLKPRLEAAQKRETDEMLGKLKGLGNSILGNFGLSTDNFKFEPNGSGGYSVNFSR